MARRWRGIATATALSCLALPALATAAETLPGKAIAGDGVLAETKPLHNLSREDLRRYRAAFDAQQRGDYAEADRQIANLDDLMLVGHLLRERYLDTARYSASQRELAEWLAAYDELPGYEEVEALAAAATPSGAGDGFAASRGTVGALDMMASPLDMMPLEPRGRDDASRTGVTRAIAPRIAAALRADRPDQAVQLLEEPRVGGRLDPLEQEIARADIAFHYYRMGDDRSAYELASAVADRSRAEVPMADWTAGLAAWRLGEPERAGIHFAALAEADNVSVWVVSAAAFWAARADLVAGRPERVLDHLSIAAAYPNSFYGLMATRLLGRDIAATPDLGQIDARSLNALAFDPSVQRAAALAAIGESDLASAELGQMRARLSPTETSGIDALAVRLGLVDPASHGSGRYPVPAWRPSEGLRVDRALLFAFAKQESGFNVHARSPVGAIGLMQLMPATARIVADRRGLDLGRKMQNLTDPGINLSLGQAYIEMLMGSADIGNNLFLVAASYNAGPGAAIKWLDEVKYNGDPLLFIESIPAAETRLFIERILANFWIYQARLGQTLETLDAAASGGWPIYVPQDRDAIRIGTKRNAG
ncbi:lytic transglycosylase domain-containing protein [Zavarzinia aquatilis]|nr:lytic transglycosylase domain-containing protein [Zavarzinia aquatilis]